MRHLNDAQDSFALALSLFQHLLEMKKSRGCMHGHCVVKHSLCIEACDAEKNYLHALLTIAIMPLLPSQQLSWRVPQQFVATSTHVFDLGFAFWFSRQLSMVWLV